MLLLLLCATEDDEPDPAWFGADEADADAARKAPRPFAERDQENRPPLLVRQRVTRWAQPGVRRRGTGTVGPGACLPGAVGHAWRN
jgi:hypothetical protein